MRSVLDVLKTIRRKPGFWIGTALILGLGVGVNTAVFSTVDAVLYRDLPYREPDRLVMLRQFSASAATPSYAVSKAVVNALATRHDSPFESVAAISNKQSLTELGLPEPEPPFESLSVSTDLLAMLGITPLHGRSFASSDQAVVRPTPALVAYSTWRGRFGGDPSAMGTVIRTQDGPIEIVGILPESFTPPSFLVRSCDFLLPYRNAFTGEADPAEIVIGVIARLKPRVDLPEAQARIDVLARQAQDRTQGTQQAAPSRRVEAVPLHDGLFGARRPLFILLSLVAVLVLLLACVNVAHALTVRLRSRRVELATRLAIGASPSTLARGVFVETVFIALIGCVSGLILAWWALEVVVSQMPAEVRLLEAPWLSVRALVIGCAASTLSLLLCCVVPIRHVFRMREGLAAPRSAARRTMWGTSTKWLAVSAQAGLGVIVLAGTSQAVRAFADVALIEGGFAVEDRYVATLTPAGGDAPDAEFLGAIRRIAGELNRDPRIAAAVSDRAPNIGNPPAAPLILDGISEGGRWQVESGWFGVAGVAFLEGRAFVSEDLRHGPHPIVLNESAVRRLAGRRAVVGEMVSIAGDQPRLVVGVVRDIRFPPGASGKPAVFEPLTRTSRAWSIVVNTTLPPLATRRLVEEAVEASGIRPRVEFVSVGEIVDPWLSAPRFTALVFGLFGIVSVIIAAIGAYGLVRLVVAEQTRHIAIRLALGEMPWRLVARIAGTALGAAMLGAGVGLLALASVGAVMGSYVSGFEAYDLQAIVTALAVLASSATLAGWFGSRQVARIDPVVVLKSQ